MLLNAHTAVLSTHVHLVPYEPHHVPTYHAWMQDEAIREATASEPLTLAEEYAMQRSWRTDADKLTFIMTLPTAAGVVDDSPARLLGDVNLFLFEDEDRAGVFGGEIELMVARAERQRRGYGRAGVLLFMWYVLRHGRDIMREAGREGALEYLRVKIGEGNARSIGLFEGLGWRKVRDAPSYFGEFELRWGDMRVEAVEELLRKYGVGEWREVEYKRAE